MLLHWTLINLEFNFNKFFVCTNRALFCYLLSLLELAHRVKILHGMSSGLQGLSLQYCVLSILLALATLGLCFPACLRYLQNGTEFECKSYGQTYIE